MEKKFFVGTGFPRKILALEADKVYNGVKLGIYRANEMRAAPCLPRYEGGGFAEGEDGGSIVEITALPQSRLTP